MVEAKTINNLNEKNELDKSLLKVRLDESVTEVEAPVERDSKLKKLLRYLEPKGMKEREDYTLYIFPPGNR